MLWFFPLSLPLAAAAAPVDPCVALEVLDANRSVAYAVGDPSLLDAIYAAGSAALATDRQVLAGYRHRGLRVLGADLELLRCRVLRQAGSEVRLAVTDRLRRSWAVDDEGEAIELPHDRPTKRIVALRLVDGRWRIE